ncbi:MAG: hypothetical protein ACK4WH_05455 [Phycisphaerales bacterium]
MRAILASVLVVAGAAASAQADFLLQEVMRTSISAATGVGNTWFIGRNLSAVAWDGSDLYVGGQSFDSSGSALAKVTPQIGTTSGLFQLSGNFGFIASSATRGIQDISVSGNTVAAAFDGGGNTTTAFRTFTTGGAAIGNGTFGARGNGVHFDPNDGLLTGLSLGSGRVLKFNSDMTTYNDGVKNWDTTTGPIVFLNSSVHRDLTMDSAGNLFYRVQNAVHRATRNGDGLGYSSVTVLKPSGVDNVNGQNLDYVSVSGFGDFVIYSDRLVGNNGQAFGSVVKALDPATGNPVSLTFDFIDAFGDALPGNGYYDFSFHAASQTLAVSDFANNTVYIFRVVPTPGALGLLGMGGLLALRRRR